MPEINDFMLKLFRGQGNVYVLDPLNMTFAVYVFTFAPATWQRYVLEDMNSLPRPAGVGVRIVVPTRRAFGFGPERLNFRGNFATSKQKG